MSDLYVQSDRLNLYFHHFYYVWYVLLSEMEKIYGFPLMFFAVQFVKHLRSKYFISGQKVMHVYIDFYSAQAMDKLWEVDTVGNQI